MSQFSSALKRTKLASAFWRDRGGNIAPLFGLMAIALFFSIGGAVDFGRWLHARNQTIAAMDSAVLAGGRALQVGESKKAAEATAEIYYTENIQGRLPLESDDIKFVAANDGLSVSAVGNAYIQTPFLSLAKIDNLALLNTDGVDSSRAEVGVGKNAGINLEISLMLDVTGSMSDPTSGNSTKLDDLKAAAKDLIDIVVWDDQSKYKSRVALVPFSEGVRLPNDRTLQKASGRRPAKFRKYYNRFFSINYYRTNCVVERTGSEAYTDAAPGRNRYVMVQYVPNNSRNCEPGANNKILPLTSNKNKLRSNIDRLQAAGGTAGQLGTAWSWYALSPNWNSLWGRNSQAAAYGTADTKKIAILMTDGDYNTQYTSQGIKTFYPRAYANSSSTFQARSLCTAMKAAGVTVYTVGFGLSSEAPAATTTMAECATDDGKAFTAEDGEQLLQAFRAIALEISKLRLTS